MIRKLALAAAVLVLVAGLAVIIAGLSLGRLLTANREALLARVAAAIGRPVRVTDIGVSWGVGLGVRLSQVEVGDDPEFGQAPFLQATTVTAHLKLVPLLARRLEIGTVVLTKPTIRVVRAADGRRNYDSLGTIRQSATADLFRRVAANEPASAPAFVPQIDSLSVRDGTIVAVDEARSPPFELTIRQVNLRLRDLRRDRPIVFALTAAAASDEPNVNLSGDIGPLGQLDRLALQLRGALGPFPQLPAVVEDLNVRAVVTPTAIEIPQLHGSAFDGSFDLSGACSQAPNGPLRLTGDLRRMSLAKLLALRGGRPAIAIEGDAAIRVDLSGQLTADVARTLRGTLAADVKHGRLRDFNLAREVLEHVAGLPGLTQMLSGRVKPKYSRLLTATDTRFEQAKATLRIADGRANTDDLSLAADDFAVRAAGWFNLDRAIDMTGSLMMSQRFSDDVVADVTAAKYIVDDNRQLAIPFRLRGKLGDAKPKPDEHALTEMLDRALSRGAATDLLNKLFGGKRQRRTPHTNDAGDPL